MNRNKWRAYLELGRVSNLPTTASNATAGFLLGGGSISDEPLAWIVAVLVTACFYEGGMFLNDIFDYSIDCKERPNRPLPSGRISRAEASVVTVLLFVVGMLGVLLFFPQATALAIALVSLILVYNGVHAYFIFSPILMGSCRGCVYLLAAVAGGWKTPSLSVYTMAGALTLYISAVSFMARSELKNSITWIHPITSALLTITLFLPLALPTETHALFLVAFLVAFAWLFQTGAQFFRKKIFPMAAVGRILAGMSLFDALVLAKVHAIMGVCIAWGCFVGARLWQKRIQST